MKIKLILILLVASFAIGCNQYSGHEKLQHEKDSLMLSRIAVLGDRINELAAHAVVVNQHLIELSDAATRGSEMDSMQTDALAKVLFIIKSK